MRHFKKTYLHIVVPAGRKVLLPKTLKAILSQSELTIKDMDI
ncbi:MAG TPA: hypothetical protein VJK09_00325 [Candidatus Paceibacterota bacterium]